jgi:predicted dehydrogenase
VGIPVLTPRVDIANARLTFPGGCVANLTASRVSVTPMRKLRIFQRNGYFTIDFLAQSAAIFRRLAGEDGGAPRVEMEELKIDLDDSLVAQLRAFVEAIKTRSNSGVQGIDALGALYTALRVIDAIPPLEDLQ